MDATHVLAIAAATFGLGMAVAPCLQIGRIINRQHSGDVSLFYLAIILIGVTTWTAYGVALGNLALIIPNAAGVISNSVAVFVVWHYRHGKPLLSESLSESVSEGVAGLKRN